MTILLFGRSAHPTTSEIRISILLFSHPHFQWGGKSSSVLRFLFSDPHFQWGGKSSVLRFFPNSAKSPRSIT